MRRFLLVCIQLLVNVIACQKQHNFLKTYQSFITTRNSEKFGLERKSNGIHSYEICDTINNEFKYCNYRDQIYPMDPKLPLFRWVTGYYCYNFSQPLTFKNGTRNKASGWNLKFFDNLTYLIPFTWVNRTANEFFFYDYKDEEYSSYVRDSFSSEDFYSKWVDCVSNAESCCESRMANINICPKGDSCPVIWDAWDCFPETAGGKSSFRTCPDYVYTSDPPCRQSSEKICQSNGTWVMKTDYSGCQYIEFIRARHVYHAVVLGVSSIFVLPAIIILSIYPLLRVMRVELHRNLLVAILAKNIFTILSKTLVLIAAMTDEDLLEYNSGWCRALAVFERIAISSMYACMLVDGFYLHKLLVRVFSKDPNQVVLHGIVAGLSVVPVLVWAIVKLVQNDVYCWIVDDSWRQWLIDGSRYAILGVNTILLLDIIRVLIWKVRDTVASNTQHTRFTLRATLVLFPLFGIQFIMTSQRPVNAKCFWDNFFYYFSYTIDALQGIIVSLLYCYLNKEVQGLLKRSYEQFKFTQERRRTTNMRKNTGSTFVDTTTSRKDTNLSISWFRKSHTQPPDIKSSTPPDNVI